MLSKQIVITSPAATGNQSYTGVGFQGKLLLVHSVSRANTAVHTGDAATAGVMFGAATSSTVRAVAVARSDDNQATSNAGARRSTVLVACVINAGGTILTGADFVSWDSDGFTLNWTTVSAGDTRSFICTVLGGPNFQATVGSAQAPAAVGNTSVTGLAFQPNTLIFFDSRLDTGTLSSSNTYARPQFGFADSASNMAAWAGESQDGFAVATTAKIQSTSACFIGTATATGAIDRRATLVSYNSDGFTLNWSHLDAVALNSWYLFVAMSAPFSTVGSTDQRTTTGTTDIVTAGYTPKVMMLGGAASTLTNSGEQDNRLSVGLAVGSASGDQGAVSLHDLDAADPTNTSSGFDTSYALRWITASGETPTTLVRASISAVSNGGFTINYDTVDATARKVMYLAIGVFGRVPRHGFTNFQGPGIV